MELRPFDMDADPERIRDWIGDEREHALWCAGRFPYPLRKDSFVQILARMAAAGDVPLKAVSGEERTVGFLTVSLPEGAEEARLKFVVVDPEYRGRGIASEMLQLALRYSFGQPGIRRVCLSVFRENTRARRCYEKAGFSIVRTEEGAFAFGDERWDRCTMVYERTDERERIC